MNMAKTFAVWAGAFFIGSLLLTGCGKGSSGRGSGAFNAASPELKTAWETAIAADKTNDYVTATLAYKEILAQRDRLSPSQVTSVEEASGKLFQRLVTASVKGDPAAKQALSQLQPGASRPKAAP